MKKNVLAVVLLLCILIFTACGSPGEADPVSTSAEEPLEVTATDSDVAEAKADQVVEEPRDDNPTISGLGLEQGNQTNEQQGVHICIQSTTWGEAERDAIYCAFTLHDVKFGVNIMYPEKIYEIHFGDESWYQYNPENSEIIDPWFDVNAELSELIGQDASGIHDEIVAFIDDYCLDQFGYKPEELMIMPYE